MLKKLTKMVSQILRAPTSGPGSKQRRPNRFTPWIESLEDRLVPAKIVVTTLADVVNPADKPKYQFWTDGPPQGQFDEWLQKAKETPGSWWLDWIEWVSAQARAKVPARKPGGDALEPLSDAPGEYVRVKA